jgi:hypothetical protein
MIECQSHNLVLVRIGNAVMHLIRDLQLGDYHKGVAAVCLDFLTSFHRLSVVIDEILIIAGYPQILSQLTTVGDVSEEKFAGVSSA